jgi:hypothetical protein
MCIPVLVVVLHHSGKLMTSWFFDLHATLHFGSLGSTDLPCSFTVFCDIHAALPFGSPTLFVSVAALFNWAFEQLALV